MLGESVVTVTPIVTELNDDDSTVEPEVEESHTTAIPLSSTLVFIE